MDKAYRVNVKSFVVNSGVDLAGSVKLNAFGPILRVRLGLFQEGQYGWVDAEVNI